MTFRFLILFFAYYEKRDSFLLSGSWIVLFWLPAETLSLKRLLGIQERSLLELHPIRLPVGLPVSVSYRPTSVGIFSMVLVLSWA